MNPLARFAFLPVLRRTATGRAVPGSARRGTLGCRWSAADVGGRRPAPSSLIIVAVLSAGWAAPVAAQLTPYNPYAETQDARPAVAADGTIHWGTFYKSADLQRAYERLWNLGACRGTNKAITGPVEQNLVAIDSLPEVTLHGVVRDVQQDGSMTMIAFVDSSVEDPAVAVKVAILHPAGVSRVSVRGDADLRTIVPGITVRARSRVDRHGKGEEEVRQLDVVSIPAGDRPKPVRPDVTGTITGTVVHAKPSFIVLRIASGTIRRVTLPLADDVGIGVDAADVRFATAGDTLEVKGRVWSGAGCLAAGTVFASDVIVVKPTRMRSGIDSVSAR